MNEQQLLEQARSLYTARDYAALSALLGTLTPAELEAEPELAFLLADAGRRLGRGEESLQILRAAAPAIQRRGDDRLDRDRLNLEGMLLFERGDVQGAETAWRELLEVSSRAGQEDFVARANNNLGVIYTLHGRREEALASYERAIAAYTRFGYRRGLAQANHNLAITYRELDFHDEADTRFRRAIRYARADGSMDEIARSELERALLIYVQKRDARMAEAMAKRGLRRFTTLGDTGEIGEAHRILGIIDLGEDRLQQAGEHLDKALENARAAGKPLLEAETLEARATLADALGASLEADALHEQASAIFAALGAPGWGDAVRSRLTALRARHAVAGPDPGDEPSES